MVVEERVATLTARMTGPVFLPFECKPAVEWFELSLGHIVPREAWFTDLTLSKGQSE